MFVIFYVIQMIYYIIIPMQILCFNNFFFDLSRMNNSKLVNLIVNIFRNILLLFFFLLNIKFIYYKIK